MVDPIRNSVVGATGSALRLSFTPKPWANVTSPFSTIAIATPETPNAVRSASTASAKGLNRAGMLEFGSGSLQAAASKVTTTGPIWSFSFASPWAGRGLQRSCRMRTPRALREIVGEEAPNAGAER